MNSKQYFIILGTILLVSSIVLLFMPTSKTDVIATITIENKVLKSPSIQVVNAKLVPNTMINIKTASLLGVPDILLPDLLLSDDLKISMTSDGKTVSKNIGNIAITDSKEVTLRISNVRTSTSKITINLYENNVLKDTKEVTL